jgi:hypothetical protein
LVPAAQLLQRLPFEVDKEAVHPLETLLQQLAAEEGEYKTSRLAALAALAAAAA